jgi:hypothetical protein
MQAAMLYRAKNGWEKKNKFSPEEKTRQDTMRSMAKMALDTTVHLIRFEKSEFSLKRLSFIAL